MIAVSLYPPATLHDPSNVLRPATEAFKRTPPLTSTMTPNMQRSQSPTPNPVINEVINEICSRWGINYVHQALPNGLSYRHTPEIEIWGEEFLILLLDLARLTEGKLDEVKERIWERIDQGRNTKLSRHTCTTREDILALIKYYGLERSAAAKPVKKSGGRKPKQEDPDEDYLPPVPKKERR